MVRLLYHGERRWMASAPHSLAVAVGMLAQPGALDHGDSPFIRRNKKEEAAISSMQLPLYHRRASAPVMEALQLRSSSAAKIGTQTHAHAAHAHVHLHHGHGVADLHDARSFHPVYG